MFKGRKNRQLEIERRIRPYRHAIIRIIKPSGGPLSYSYIQNEFNNALVSSLGDGAGIYAVNLNSSSFKNLNNVVQETDIVHTTAGAVIVTSAFTSSLRQTIQIDVFDPATFNNIDIDGEIILLIKEFYE